MKSLLIGVIGALIAVALIAFSGQAPDTSRDRALENTLLLMGVPDTTIEALMEMREKTLIVDDRFVEGDYFYVTPDRRRGYVVHVDDGCMRIKHQVFNLDDNKKRR